MPEPYNLTLMSGQDTIYGFMTGANTVSGGLIGSLSLIVIFLIAFVNFKSYEGKRAFAGASFITALIAVLFRVMVWIPDVAMFTTFIIAGVSLLFLLWS